MNGRCLKATTIFCIWKHCVIPISIFDVVYFLYPLFQQRCIPFLFYFSLRGAVPGFLTKSTIAIGMGQKSRTRKTRIRSDSFLFPLAISLLDAR